ncbi:MAG: glutamine-hydrolyzing carbamoyl-phosphate synthase small subunit [Gammaproteobacteria bacterium]|nr:glutamine-hydrolyzing carbamoyl-phosphate synthase small subunit [Gammaproteobacteria bacterium]
MDSPDNTNDTIAVLALEQGLILQGVAIGAIENDKHFTCGEVVFNTAMTGYQEVISDPSYCEQIIMFTAPHIGNVGVNKLDTESDETNNRIWSNGIIINYLSLVDSSWRAESSLNNYLIKNKLIGIANIDTRALTVALRDHGAQKGCIYLVKNKNNLKQDLKQIAQEALRLAREHRSLANLDLAKVVTCSKTYTYQSSQSSQSLTSHKIHIIVYDFGVKLQILRLLANRHCRVTVVPAITSIEQVLAMKPDGVVLSNGPGDPAACEYAIENTKKLLQTEIPVFGICLGFQILALAMGAKTVKMKFGHHGSNHPVQDLESRNVMITSQNHGFMVDEKSLTDQIIVTHRSLFDQTIQGIKHISLPVIAFQGHPEASPGPKDMEYLFDVFIENASKYQIKSASTSFTSLV